MPFKSNKGRGNVNFSIDASDVQNLIPYFRELRKAGIRAVKKELLATSKAILKEAKVNVPVKTGALKMSGRILKPRKGATKTKFDYSVIFGGKISKGIFVDYAFVVHEFHRTKSQFLLRAYVNQLQGISNRLDNILAIHIKKVRKI